MIYEDNIKVNVIVKLILYLDKTIYCKTYYTFFYLICADRTIKYLLKINKCILDFKFYHFRD